jgi:hypothetical protein
MINSAGTERFNAVRSTDDRRRERRECNLWAVITTLHGETGARLLNISAGGVGFAIDPVLGLKPGERIMLRQQLLGEVRCIVRWAMHPRYGAEFEPEGRTPPGACTLYDSVGPGAAKSG